MVTITPSVLREQVEQGMKLDALAEHYELPKTQMKKALQQLGLKIRRFHEPKFVFAEEEETQSHHNTNIDDVARPEFPSTLQDSIVVDSSSNEEEEETIPERVSRESESLTW